MSELELNLYGDIGGDGITVGNVRTTLNYIKNNIDTSELMVRIISYGGNVQESMAIIDAFNEFKNDTGIKVTTINDNYTASAGMNILVGIADKVMGTPRSIYLIHRAWTIAAVNSRGAKELAERLEKVTEPSIELYMAKTGKSKEEIEAQMDKEDWMSIQEAIDFGLVDDVYQGALNTDEAQQYLSKVSHTDDELFSVAQQYLNSEIKLLQKVRNIKNI